MAISPADTYDRGRASLASYGEGSMVAQKGKEKLDGKDGRAERSLEERLGGLNLQGEEEDLDFSKEFDELVKDVHWLALFRVHTTKPFSHAAHFSAMRNAWAAAKDVTFKVMEPNLFIV